MLWLNVAGGGGGQRLAPFFAPQTLKKGTRMKVSKRLSGTFALLFLDFIWLFCFMGKQYAPMVHKIQHTPLRAKLSYAVFAYACMILGLQLFVLQETEITAAETETEITAAEITAETETETETEIAAETETETTERGCPSTTTPVSASGVLHAFAFGVVIYGVYNGTSGSIFRDWNLVVACLDTVWGGVVYALAYIVACWTP